MTYCSRQVKAGFLLWGLLMAAQPATAQITWTDVLSYRPPPAVPVLTPQALAKAAPDECFDGIGVDYPPLSSDGRCDTGVPKQNQGYVWGLAQAGIGTPAFEGDEVWFGTVANPLCGGASGGIIDPVPDLTVSWVCEYGQSMLARRPVLPLPPGAGDWRLPRAYSYNLREQRLTDRTPRDPIFQIVAGLRSAGSLGSMVFLAGPSFQSDVVFAAWDAASGSYLGACRATELNQIRQWITVNGVLYAGAGRDRGDGVLLRWRGSTADPFDGAPRVSDYCGFEIVGVLPAFPAYLANYDGKRLAASAWNQATLATGRAPQVSPAALAGGVYLGPVFGSDGSYTADHAGQRWRRLWVPELYEPDPVVAATTGGGAMTFWRGWLWFGTMHNNSSTATAHSRCPFPFCYGPADGPEESVQLLFQVSRAASIWRARIDPDGRPEVQLLYGQTELPALVPGTKTFEMKPTGWVPLHGKAGFGNPFGAYTWASAADADRLVFGLYDYRYVFDVRLGIVAEGGPIDPRRGYGADLWRFDAADAPAQPENLDGFGNFANYGVRNLLTLDSEAGFIAGTANALSLEPDGGWELLRLSPPPQAKRPGR